MPECLLTVRDVMTRLNLSRATVYRLIGQGKLAPVKVGRCVRFLESNVDAFIRNVAEAAAELA